MLAKAMAGEAGVAFISIESLRAHREELVRLSEELIAHSELSSDQVLAILGSNLQIAASEPASTWAKRLADEPDPAAAASPAKRRKAKQ